MAYRAYQPERREKRRRWLMIVLTLVLVILVVAFLVTRQTEQRGTVEFFAAADEAAALHADAADALEETLSQLGPLLSRQEVTRRLEAITSQAADADQLLQVEVPPSIGDLYGTLIVASDSWVRGTSEMERVLLGMIDGEIVQGAEQELQTALDILRVGDTSYGLFLDGVAGFESDVSVPDFPPVSYIDPAAPDPLLYDAQNLALRTLAAYNLAPRHDLSVVGMTDPEPAGDRGGIPVVPFSEAIGVNVVISNAGNEEESAIAVDLTVLNVDTGESLTEEAVVAVLAPGASTTVTFAELPIEPGGLYQVTASATIPEDARPENSSWSLTFIWNGDS